MYSRNFESSPPPNNYGGTLYRSEKAEEVTLTPDEKASAVPSDRGHEKNTEKPHSLLSKGFSIHLDTEDLLLLGLAFLLMANGEESDMMLILALLFATGIFF